MKLKQVNIAFLFTTGISVLVFIYLVFLGYDEIKTLKDVVKIVNINKLLTETDAPFLSPYEGKRNEPAFVIESLKKIAEIKGFTIEETANTIWMNYQRLFLW